MVHPFTKAEFDNARILVAEGGDSVLIRKASVNVLKRAVANSRQKVVLQHGAWARD
jgi:predicted RNA methylase